MLHRKHKLLWLIPLGFIGLTFFYPLIAVLNLGFGSHLFSAGNEQGIFSVLGFTIWQAAISTGLAILLGIPAAYLFYRKLFPGLRTLRAIITVPFMLPSLIIAMAIIEMGRPFGGFDPVFAIILANVLANFSVVVRNVGSQWQSIDLAQEEEAELSGSGRFLTALVISLPQLTTSIRSTIAIVMLYCASSYGIVLSLGGGRINTLETALSISVLQRLDLQHGAALALLQICITVFAFTVSRWGGANPLTLDSSAGNSKALDKRDLPIAIFTFLVTALFVVIPLGLVFAKAFFDSSGNFTFINFLLLETRGYRDLLNISLLEAGFNSLRNLLVASVIALIIGTLVSYLLAHRTRSRNYKKNKTDLIGITLDGIFLLPVGISAVVLGLGYLISLNGNLAGIRSSWFVVPLVQSVLAIPLVIRIVYPTLLAIADNQREQAYTDGAKSSQVFFLIDLAIAKPALRAALAYSALVSLGEFGVASLLSYGDQTTVPVLLYQLIARPGNGNYQMALALAALLFVITTITVLLIDNERKTKRS
jgi:thiamine transport system permease protein